MAHYLDESNHHALVKLPSVGDIIQLGVVLQSILQRRRRLTAGGL